MSKKRNQRPASPGKTAGRRYSRKSLSRRAASRNEVGKEIISTGDTEASERKAAHEPKVPRAVLQRVRRKVLLARGVTVGGPDKSLAVDLAKSPKTPPPEAILPRPKRMETPWIETFQDGFEGYGPPIDRPSAAPWQDGPLKELAEVRGHFITELTSRGPLSAVFTALKQVGSALSPDTLFELLQRLMLSYRSIKVDEFGFDSRYFGLMEPVLEFLYKKYWRVETLGVSNIPHHGKALLVANHSGTLPLDGAMILYAVRRDHRSHRPVRPLVEDFMFHFPFVGSFINRIGGVRACQENAERLLDGGQLVAVFPEGIQGSGKLFSDRYKLQRFGRGGFVKLALRTQAPVIPVAVVGAEEIFPMVAKVTWPARWLGLPFIPITPLFPVLGPIGMFPLPSKWIIRFGEPLQLHEIYGPDALSDRLIVNRISEQIRSTIQSMVEDTLKERASVFAS